MKSWVNWLPINTPIFDSGNDLLLNEGELLQSNFFRTKILYGQDDCRKSLQRIMERGASNGDNFPSVKFVTSGDSFRRMSLRKSAM